MPVVVISDVDGVLREGKGIAVPSKIRQGVASFRRKGGIFNMITGGPLAHVPDIPAHMVFAEAGGVRVTPRGKYVFEEGRVSVLALRQHLGILQKNGFVETSFGSLIVEGPRWTSLALLFGCPSHYPGCVTSANMEEVHARIGKLGLKFPLMLSKAHDTNFGYVDVFSFTKRQAIEAAMCEAGWDNAYFLGDKDPDFEAMSLKGIIPVGFPNSIEEIRALARERGVYIDLPGPQGGVAEFFRRLNNGKI